MVVSSEFLVSRYCERSEAIHRCCGKKAGLLRRFAPLRNRFAFVAGNDRNVTP
jgi:hypothetical protein